MSENNPNHLLSEAGRRTELWYAYRRAALWARTFQEILRTGKFRTDLPATNGLRVSELATRERGGILFIENPDPEHRVTGSVFPYLPEITLEPGEVFAYVHDCPIGPSDRYLSAYAGLVKSDASVLTAHVLPDPYDGIRVYVYGTPGTVREVALFNPNDRGKGVDVSFADFPQVYPIGPSQIIALPTRLAGRTFLPDDENTPVLIGPDDVRDHGPIDAIVELPPGRTHTLWSLRPDGTLTEISVDTRAEPEYAAPDFDDSQWREMEEPTGIVALGNGDSPYGWYRARLYIEDETDAELRFAAYSDRLTLWVNGEKIGSSPVAANGEYTFDLRLVSGENTLCLLAENREANDAPEKGIYGPVTLIPSGSCYLLDITRWRFMGGESGPEVKDDRDSIADPEGLRKAQHPFFAPSDSCLQRISAL